MNLRFFLILAVIIGALTRFLWLENLPVGVHEDEIAFLFNAYSYATTGKNEWGITIPQALFQTSKNQSLASFGDTNLYLFSFGIIPVTAFFGFDIIPIRFFSALVGLLSVIPVWFITKELTRSLSDLSRKAILVLTALFFLINPLHILLSRRAIDPSFSLLMMLTTIWLSFRGFRKNQLLSSILLVLLLILQLTAYYPTKMFLLLFLPTTLGISFFLFQKETLNKKYLYVSTSIVFLFIASFTLYQFGHDNAKVTQNSAFGSYSMQGVISDLNEKLGACQIKVPPLVCKVFYNKPLTALTLLAKNYTAHFSSNFFFSQGVGVFDTSFMKDRGLLYLFEFGLFIIGLTQLHLFSPWARLVIIAWLFIFPIPDSLSGAGTPRRMLTGLPVLALLSAMGTYTLYEHLLKLRIHRFILLATFALLITWSITKFMLDYYWYAGKAGKYFRAAEVQTFNQLAQLVPSYNIVYITQGIPQAYLYYIYYTKLQPKEFLQAREMVQGSDPLGPWIKVKRIGKVNFEESEQSLPKNLPIRSLIVASPHETWLTKKYPTLTKVSAFEDSNHEIEQVMWLN